DGRGVLRRMRAEAEGSARIREGSQKERIMSTAKLAANIPNERARVDPLVAIPLMGALLVGFYLCAMKLRRVHAGAVMVTSTYEMSGSIREGSRLSQTKRSVQTPSGRISYLEQGTGPVALFVQGVLLNGHLWRHQLADLSDIRRNIAVDLLAHGDTEIEPDQ